ncbi:MAG: PEP-CTERM sorting domain-containing protein [Planctomycetota bacterium]|nr:PEP-CTERM sorting domain-containing protein [Planctomycetota bacterium]
MPAPRKVHGFSGTQGLNNWYYGYTNVIQHPTYAATPGGTDYFVQLPWYVLITNKVRNEYAWQFNVPENPWTFLGAGTAHPNGSDQWSGGSTDVHWAIRRYVSEAAGTLTVNWSLSKADIGGNPWANGTTGRIFHNGVQEDSRTIAWNDGTGYSVTTQIPGVQVGDYIDLVLDATGTFSSVYGGWANGQWDLSNYSATITVPEPATLALLAAGGLLAIRRRR